MAPNLTGMNKTAHAPTLVYAIVGAVVVVFLYHCLKGKRR